MTPFRADAYETSHEFSIEDSETLLRKPIWATDHLFLRCLWASLYVRAEITYRDRLRRALETAGWPSFHPTNLVVARSDNGMFWVGLLVETAASYAPKGDLCLRFTVRPHLRSLEVVSMVGMENSRYLYPTAQEKAVISMLFHKELPVDYLLAQIRRLKAVNVDAADESEQVAAMLVPLALSYLTRVKRKELMGRLASIKETPGGTSLLVDDLLTLLLEGENVRRKLKQAGPQEAAIRQALLEAEKRRLK